MSFGLARGRELSDEGVGVPLSDLPPLPDTILTDRAAGHIDPRRWFPDPALPFDLEIGSGKGTFLVNQCPLDPGANYLGIEHAREFYLYAADRLRRRIVPNVRMLNTDAVEFLRWRMPPAIIRTIHLYYSDPWPKKRHHKNRVVQDAFLEDVHRALVPGGELRIVTDHIELWAWCREHVARWTGGGGAARFAEESFVPPEWVGDGQTIGTNYEVKTTAAGRSPRACVLRKV
jgi:tRNA (guanine-N7-)-methyltransferase